MCWVSKENQRAMSRVSRHIMFVFSLEKCQQVTRFLISHNIALKNHVIRRLQLPTHLQCRAACSAQHGCLSFNFTPRQEGDGDCELNDSEDSQHPEDLEQRDGNKYYASQVKREEKTDTQTETETETDRRNRDQILCVTVEKRIKERDTDRKTETQTETETER